MDQNQNKNKTISNSGNNVDFYFKIFTDLLNENLANISDIVQRNLSLDFSYMPDKLQQPIVFMGIVIIFLITIIFYINTIIVNFIGVFYPLIYSMGLFNQEEMDYWSLILINKYWIIFGGLSLLDNLMGFILRLVPGYNYILLAFTYLLIRNDFTFSGTVFDFIERKIQESNMKPMINNILSRLNAIFIGSSESTDPSKKKKDS